jgi:hypothetical protein
MSKLWQRKLAIFAKMKKDRLVPKKGFAFPFFCDIFDAE